MVLGAPGRPREKLGVMRMALALVLAAFLGAALGLVWQSSSFFEDDEEVEVLTTQDEAITVPGSS